MASVLEASDGALSSAPAAPFATRALGLAVLVLVAICSWADRQLFSMLLEPIKHEFSLADFQMGLLGGTAFGLFYVTVGLPVAWLADRSSRRTIIATATALWSLVTSLTGAAVLLPRRIPERQPRLAQSVPGVRRSGTVAGDPGPSDGVRAATQGGALLGPGGHSSAGSFFSTLRHFLSRRTLRHIPVGGAAHGLGMFAAAVWMPAYLMRTFHMQATAAGARLAVIMGLAGLFGTLAGGPLVDRVVASTADTRWYLRCCGGFLAGFGVTLAAGCG